MDSLKVTDDAAAAHAVAPRVAIADIENAIGARFEFTADKIAAGVALQTWAPDFECPIAFDRLPVLSICILVMKNGYVLVGTSAAAATANFDADLGRKLAYQDAIRQLWPLMGFALREKLAA